jgi:hypothetical protein
MRRRAARLEVARRRAQHSPDLSHLHCTQAGIRQVADAYRNIQPFFDQIDHAVGELGIHFDLRKAAHVVDDARHNEGASEQHRGGDGQNAARLGVDAADRFVGLVDTGQDGARVIEVLAPGVGHAYVACRAQQQGRAQFVLESDDGPRDRCRRYVEPARGGGETALLAHSHEHAHQVNLVHPDSPGETMNYGPR